MKDLFAEKVGEVSVGSLIESGPLVFDIPPYQRGYRWQSKQLKALLNDFDRKWPDGNAGGKYLLQPIVLKKKAEALSIVDGQQRLTTIGILIDVIFADDDKVRTKLWRIIAHDEQSGCLSRACKENAKRIFSFQEWTRVLEKVKAHLDDILFIYYVLEDDEDEHKAFERLNAGKIGLTDAELIRALFITEGNAWADEIAAEWEQIETSLHDDSFWYMFNDSEPKTPTRIDRIFRIVTGTERGRVRGESFWKIESSISRGERTVEAWWNDVLNVYWMLKHCHDNVEDYHYIGWISHMTDVQFGRVFDLYKKDRAKFTANLQKNILGRPEKDARLGFKSLYLVNKENGYDFRNGELRYLHPNARNDGFGFPERFVCENGNNFDDIVTDRHSIRALLLLFNLESLNQRDKNVVRFPFKMLLLQTWEIEHIASHHPRLEGEDMRAGEIAQPDKNMVGNLALLDKLTNVTYQDAEFDEKRKYIFGVDGKSLDVFVPSCTKEVFAKAYSTQLRETDLWSFDDAADYLGMIVKVISNMWNKAGLPAFGGDCK